MLAAVQSCPVRLRSRRAGGRRGSVDQGWKDSPPEGEAEIEEPLSAGSRRVNHLLGDSRMNAEKDPVELRKYSRSQMTKILGWFSVKELRYFIKIAQGLISQKE